MCVCTPPLPPASSLLCPSTSKQNGSKISHPSLAPSVSVGAPRCSFSGPTPVTLRVCVTLPTAFCHAQGRAGPCGLRECGSADARRGKSTRAPHQHTTPTHHRSENPHTTPIKPRHHRHPGARASKTTGAETGGGGGRLCGTEAMSMAVRDGSDEGDDSSDSSDSSDGSSDEGEVGAMRGRWAGGAPTGVSSMAVIRCCHSAGDYLGTGVCLGQSQALFG